jgi:LuxR family transcriptional regulator, maltose regulon positive regulatory protein
MTCPSLSSDLKDGPPVCTWRPSVRDRPAPANFARDVTGGNRYIVDFLAEEVIGCQPGPIQQFLMRTAVLSRFAAPLCGAATGTANARDVIDKLERENFFLIALDEAGMVSLS